MEFFENFDIAAFLSSAADVLPFVALGLLIVIWLIILVRHIRFRRNHD